MADRSPLAFLTPDWPAPASVRALSTTRRGGVSSGPFEGFNLGTRTGDTADAVHGNRVMLRQYVPGEPQWVQQVHGPRAVELPAGRGAEADAVWTRQQNVVCAMLTADCLPVLLCDRAGTRVGAAHAGWRGLLAGVLESTVAALDAGEGELLAWLGPAISQRAFEVGPEVRAAFIERHAEAESAFIPGQGDRWFADLNHLACQRLVAAGVRAVYGGDTCTWSEPERFYSYRRDGVTGRMASLIWITAPV